MSAGEPVEGVVFDLDGVLIDSEHVWEESWSDYARSVGFTWTHEDTLSAQGMSATEWSAFIGKKVGRPDDADGIARRCVAHFVRRVVHDGEGALLPGARELVTNISDRVPVALASSAARRAIDAILDHHGLTGRFRATVSSEEVPQGKPNPDVYLEAVRRLGLAPQVCLAVEDSTNGIFAAHAAKLRVVAVPNPTYPPRDEATELAVYVADNAATAGEFIASLLDEGGRS